MKMYNFNVIYVSYFVFVFVFFIVVSAGYRGRRKTDRFRLLTVYKIVDFSSIQDRTTSCWSTYADLRIRCLGDHRY
jgi:hypothetical protein